jgi:hypothetical protein
MNKWFMIFVSIIIEIGVFSSCTPAQQPIQPESVNTLEPIESASTQDTDVFIVPTATELPYLISPLDFSEDAAFCVEEPAGSPFSLSCAEGALTISQKEGRRKTDIYLLREEPLTSGRFSLSADVNSQPVDMDKFDQNQFGFYFTKPSGTSYVLRVQGQYLNFEEWEITDSIEVVDAYNKTYAPALYSPGRTNNFRLTCGWDFCKLFANDTLVAHSPFGTGDGISALGFFTASAWDQQFGSITLESFSATELSGNLPELQHFYLQDDLSSNHGTFSQMGLSGAFSEFEEDGFHFSPVIPYGYYAAKADPSLANVSVSVVVNMEIDPGVKATRYAGVICRSSLEGKYMAVLRADGTYTIFRDTTKRPFALLAQDQIEGIQSGKLDNTIRLDCIGDTISLYINSTLVESFTDSHYVVRYGRAGLFTKAGGAPNSDAVVFSDFSIEEIR